MAGPWCLVNDHTFFRHGGTLSLVQAATTLKQTYKDRSLANMPSRATVIKDTLVAHDARRFEDIRPAVSFIIY